MGSRIFGMGGFRTGFVLTNYYYNSHVVRISTFQAVCVTRIFSLDIPYRTGSKK